jgi:hypothetical protein
MVISSEGTEKGERIIYTEDRENTEKSTSRDEFRVFRVLGVESTFSALKYAFQAMTQIQRTRSK